MSSLTPISSSCSTIAANTSVLGASTTTATRSLATSAMANTGISGTSRLCRESSSTNETLYSTGSSAEPVIFRRSCKAAFAAPGQADSDSTLLVDVAVDPLDAYIGQCGA